LFNKIINNRKLKLIYIISSIIFWSVSRIPRKKVVGIAGRFGARYGSSIRKRWKAVMERRYQEYRCPYCGKIGRLERISVGIWRCPRCGAVWAGGAYTPTTEVGASIIVTGVASEK
jgi:large subunit ribosomal protein L37Ae